jgi:oligoribonuclease NrnB/cAMP/cGMP phosphodiesterase (DHH superfamily)
MDTIRPNEQVYIVDFSISLDEMRLLLSITDNVTWIDHHKTAIEKYQDFEHQIRGVRYDGIAGCMLTYCYIHHMTSRGEGEIKSFDISMTEDAPLFTKLIADWDVWKLDYGDETRNFITAFNAYKFEPDSSDWFKFFEEDNYEYGMITKGESMRLFRDGWAENYMKLGFETIFEGVKCYAVNLGHCNSEYFKSLSDGKYDVFIPFVFDGDQYTVSLYSKTVDVSEIAKIYGGGGHKGASGFQCRELPFRKE